MNKQTAAVMPSADDSLVRALQGAMLANRTGVHVRDRRESGAGPMCPRCQCLWLDCPHPAAVLGPQYAAP